MKDNERYWFWAKVSLVFFWLNVVIKMIAAAPQANLPVGICQLFSFDWFFVPPAQYFLYPLALGLALLYVFEKKMVYTTGALALFSLVVISQHESSGLFLRATSYTVIFGVQFLAYAIFSWKTDFDYRYYRLQFPVQVVAATYVLAGLSKLNVSGWEWVNSGHLFSLQVIKNESFRYFDTGNLALLQQAQNKAVWFLTHKGLITFMLTSSLLLELFCPVVLIGRKTRIVYGVLLVAMHIGIYVVMGIMIGGIAFNMLIFFINPLYHLVNTLKQNKAHLTKH
jgi:hypothetical protein